MQNVITKKSASGNSDVGSIAENTGFSEDEIARVKKHIFFDFHNLGEKKDKRFDPDYDMAVSWQRLIDGKNIQEMDFVLLRHEIVECDLMAQGLSYGQAHDKAENLYSYSKYVNQLQLEAGL